MYFSTLRDGRIERCSVLTHMRVVCSQSITNISFNQICGQKQLGLQLIHLATAPAKLDL